jgi:hypothetical protein
MKWTRPHVSSPPRLRERESLFLAFAIWVLYRNGWVAVAVLTLLATATLWATARG